MRHLGCLSAAIAALLVGTAGETAGQIAGALDGGPPRSPEVDGAWTQVCPAPDARWHHSAIYDPVWNRMILFGGELCGNEVWSLSLSGVPAWSRLATSGEQPPAMESHSSIYDPVRHRMIVFAGSTLGTETWALSLSGDPVWSRLSTSSAPLSARRNHTAVYDPIRDRMLVFGGYDGYMLTFYNDVWALSLSGVPAWTQLTPSGTPPSARFEHTAVYDPGRDRMLVFGGRDQNDIAFNDTWELSLAGTPAWHRLDPSGNPPTARCAHSAIYDPVRRRMVIFGGPSRNDAWALTLTGTPAWIPYGPAGDLPPHRACHSAVYDPSQDRMVVFGGYGSSGPLDDTWALSLAGVLRWDQLLHPAPFLAAASAILDPTRHRMVVVGGWHALNDCLNETWTVSFQDDPPWQPLDPQGTPPSPRQRHTAIYDPLRDRMVVFGGSGGVSGEDSTWALSLGDSPTWSRIIPEGPLPGRRQGHVAIYDSVRDRMVVFGGRSGNNETWVLSLSDPPSWSRLEPAGTPPPPLSGHAAVYDAARDRMVIFSGSDYAGHAIDDVWALSFAGTPTWSHLEPGDPAPSARVGHVAIYDPIGARMVVFGGSIWFDYPSEVWSLALDGAPAWTELGPTGIVLPFGRSRPMAVYDPSRRGMLVFGGEHSGGVAVDEAWELSWRPPAGTPGRGAFVLQTLARGPVLRGATPNPFHGSTTIRLYIPAPGTRATLGVYDVSGRRVRTLLGGETGSGALEACWDGRDDAGRDLPSGVYLTRMDMPAGTVTGRIVLAR